MRSFRTLLCATVSLVLGSMSGIAEACVAAYSDFDVDTAQSKINAWALVEDYFDSGSCFYEAAQYWYYWEHSYEAGVSIVSPTQNSANDVDSLTNVSYGGGSAYAFTTISFVGDPGDYDIDWWWWIWCIIGGLFVDDGDDDVVNVCDATGQIASLMTEYQTYPVSLSPVCPDFTQTRQSLYFSFGEINTGDYSWALVADALIAPSTSTHGLDKFRQTYGGPRILNSAYRNPARNALVGGATNSRHMYADAADVRNESQTQDEWNQMWYAAYMADASYIEPLSGPCGLACLHLDWRNYTGAYDAGDYR